MQKNRAQSSGQLFYVLTLQEQGNVQYQNQRTNLKYVKKQTQIKGIKEEVSIPLVHRNYQPEERKIAKQQIPNGDFYSSSQIQSPPSYQQSGVLQRELSQAQVNPNYQPPINVENIIFKQEKANSQHQPIQLSSKPLYYQSQMPYNQFSNQQANQNYQPQETIPNYGPSQVYSQQPQYGILQQQFPNALINQNPQRQDQLPSQFSQQQQLVQNINFSNQSLYRSKSNSQFPEAPTNQQLQWQGESSSFCNQQQPNIATKKSIRIITESNKEKRDKPHFQIISVDKNITNKQPENPKAVKVNIIEVKQQLQEIPEKNENQGPGSLYEIPDIECYECKKSNANLVNLDCYHSYDYDCLASLLDVQIFFFKFNSLIVHRR